MASQFGFRISGRNLNEADDPARAALTTQGQSPAIRRKPVRENQIGAVGTEVDPPSRAAVDRDQTQPPAL